MASLNIPSTQSVPVINFSSQDTPQQLADRVLQSLDERPVVHLRPSRPVADPLSTRDLFESMAYLLGEVLPSGEDSLTGEPDDSIIWCDLRFDREMQQTFRHSCTAQPLHTDGAFDDQDRTDIIMFHCQAQVPKGGETFFMYGDYLLNLLQKERPELVDPLHTVNLEYRRYALKKSAPILSFQDDKVILNWNHYRLVEDQPADALALADDFRAFLDHIVDRGDVIPLRLNPGEGLLFKDQEVLHGRPAFAPDGDDSRWFWKLYLCSSECSMA